MLDPVVPDPDGFGSQIGVTECEQAGFVNRLAGRLALTRDDWPRRLAKTTGEGLTAYRDLA